MFPVASQIVVIEGSSYALETLKSALAASGYLQVQGFANVDEAWGYLHSVVLSAVTPVLVFCHQRMLHGLTGLDFLKKMRSHPATEKVPFIMISAEWDRIRLVEAFSAGATGYLVKPYSIEDLQRTLQFTWKRSEFESRCSAPGAHT